MFNKLQNFKEQGYILVSRLKREDAIKAMKNVLDYFLTFIQMLVMNLVIEDSLNVFSIN